MSEFNNNFRKGKIYLLGINSINDFEFVKNKFFIVQSCKNPGYYMNKGWKLVPQLAPTQDLFFKYLNLKRQGKWGVETFNNMYTPIFLKQLEINLVTKKALMAVQFLLNNGEDIAFMCYCNDLNLCHRKLLGEYYYRLGYEVIFG